MPYPSSSKAPASSFVASARVLGATLLTQDGRIVESALVPTVS